MMRRMKATISVLLIALLLLSGVTAASAEPSRAQPASRIAAYDEAHPESLTQGHLYGQSAILIDASSGRVLFEKDADRQMYPASTTKIMTALLVLEHLEPDEVVTCSNNATKSEPTWIPVYKNEKFTVKQLLYALLMKSANDAAIALAEAVSGSVEAFAELMTQRAAELGCTDTQFRNANGLPNTSHYTTARDMSLIAQAAFKHEMFRQIITTTDYTIPPTNKRDEAIEIHNSNRFLSNSGDKDYSYPYGIGMKTGYTNAAQSAFVGAAQKNGQTLISVVFGTTTTGKWLDTIKMMDYGFAVSVTLDVAALYERVPHKVAVSGALDSDTQNGLIELMIDPAQREVLSAYCGTQSSVDEILSSPQACFTIVDEPAVKAPVAQGQKLATLLFQGPGMIEPFCVDLVAQSDVAVKPMPTSAPPAVAATPAATAANAGESALFPVKEDSQRKTILGYTMLAAAGAAALVVLSMILVTWRRIRLRKKRQQQRRMRRQQEHTDRWV